MCHFLHYHCIVNIHYSQQLAIELDNSKQRQQQLYDNARQIKEDSRNIVSSMTKTVDKKVNAVLQDVTSQLSNLVDSFGFDDFDQRNLLPYKEVSLYAARYCYIIGLFVKRLYEVIDSNVVEQLRQNCALELQKLHNSGLQKIAGNTHILAMLSYVYASLC